MSPDRAELKQNTEDIISPSPSLEIPRDRRGRIRWSLPGNTDEENLQLGMRNIQALFLEKHPDFLLSFPFNEQGKIPEDQREEAVAFIVDRISYWGKFVELFGTTPTNRSSSPYFDGYWFVAVQKSFAPWGISLEYRVVDRKTKRYIGDKESWVSPYSFAKEYGVDRETIEKHLRYTPSINGTDASGHSSPLYNEKKLLGHMQDFLSLPQVDPCTGKHTDEDGRSFVPIPLFLQEFKDQDISRMGISNCLKGIPFIKGKAGNNNVINLYDEVKAKEEIQKFIRLPKVDPEHDCYTDEEGEEWRVKRYFVDKFDIHYTGLKPYLNQVRTIVGRDKSGKKNVLFNVSELIVLIKPFVSSPRVDKKSGLYKDKMGEEWVPARFIRDSLGVNWELISSIVGRVRTIHGRDKSSRPIDLINLSDVMEQLKDFLDRKRDRTITISPKEANEQLRRLLETE